MTVKSQTKKRRGRSHACERDRAEREGVTGGETIGNKIGNGGGGKWSRRDVAAVTSWKVNGGSTRRTIASSSARILRAEHVRGMLARFICVISANTCGNACPSNANARREKGRGREGERERSGSADVRRAVRSRTRAVRRGRKYASEGTRACHNYTHMEATGCRHASWILGKYKVMGISIVWTAGERKVFGKGSSGHVVSIVSRKRKNTKLGEL